MQKIAVVTGGSRGIGFGIASQLAEDGFHVVIMAVSPREKHKEHLLLLENYPSGYTYIQGSIASREDRIRCISQVIREYGRIDVLVNNAGIAPQKRTDLLDMTEESFDELIQTNTKGTMFLSQLAAKQMLCQEAVNGGLLLIFHPCRLWFLRSIGENTVYPRQEFPCLHVCMPTGLRENRYMFMKYGRGLLQRI